MGDKSKWRVGVSRRICALLAAIATLFTAGIVAASLPQTQASAATGTSYDRTLGNASFQAARQKYGLAENMREGATLHAFEWSFKTIEENIPDIAAAGYTSVQTEPIQKIKDNRKLGTGNWYLNWYYIYQPVDMSIGNYVVGSEDDFKSMCETAHKYGVRIIVDVVANHFTSDFDVIVDRWRNKSYFHEDKQISDYNNREDCTQHKLSGLWDLNTQDPTVTQGMADLLKQMVADGADGFRYDAAKHIELPDEVFGGKTSNYWNTILPNGAQYQYGEVLEDANVREADYADLFWNSSTGKGGITDSSFGHEVRNGVQHGSLSASHFTQHNKVTEDKTVNWVESHDNFANGEANIPQELDDEWIMYGWAGITAQKNGMTLFFDRPYKDGGTYGTGGKGTYGNGSGPFTENSKLGDAGDDMWKDPRIVAVNHFRNSMIGENSNVSNCGDDDLCLMVERYAGSSAQDGVVVANAKGSDKSLAGTSTKLANGTYKDEVTGSTLTVSGGTITSGTVKAKSVAAFSNKTRNPIVSTAEAYPNKGTIPGTSKKITLRAYQAENTTYSVSDGQAGTYKDGDVITIGANASGGDVITVTVKGTAADGSSIEHTYSYVKFGDPTWDPSDGTESPCDKYCVTYLQKNGWNADTYIDAEEPNFTGSRSRVQPTGVTISGDDVSNGTVTRDISTGNDTTRLKATVAPEGASQTVTWSSSDSSVASVDSTGTVTMLKAGTATITATTTNSLSASVTVTVTGQVTPVESVSVTPTSLDMLKGDTAQLTATVAPSNATVKRITWSSSDSSVASVDSTGKVTAVKRGTATITATSNNGKTATVPVTVTSAVNNIIYVTKPSGWSTVYAYVYANGGKTQNAAWPGVALTQMTSDDSCAKSGTYMYEVPDDLAEDSQVIFSDKGSNQYPASRQPGLAYTGGAVTWASGQSSFTDATCTPPTVAVTSVTLNKSALSLTEGDSETLTATVAPSNATDKTITWSSSDDSVATVNGGIVTAVKAGTATITATSSNGKSATCTVTVKAKTPERIDVTGVTISTDSLELVEGQNGTLTASVAPSNATDKTITWSSSDDSVATVNNGIVTAVKEGGAIIKATASNGKYAQAVVTVKAKAPEIVDVKQIIVQPGTSTLTVGASQQLSAIVLPNNATNKTVTWKSNNASVAIVDQNGLATAVGEGNTQIVATSADGKISGYATVIVSKSQTTVDVTSVTLNKSALDLTEGDSETLAATVAPSNATDKTVTWRSSDSSVATVSANGTVTAVKAGTATITATAGGKSATCTLTVNPVTVPVTGVTVAPENASVTAGQTVQLAAVVAPSNATNKAVAWYSETPSVATVDANGVVTGVKEGTARIVAFTSNGVSGAATVTVSAKTTPVVPVTGVTVSPNSASVTVGQATQLAAVVAPSNATNKAVAWYSETPSVATVDANGVVTGVKEGTARIVAFTSNGVSGAATVTVSAKTTPVVPVTGVTVSPGSASVTVGQATQLTAVVAPSNATNKAVTWTVRDPAIATVDANGVVTALTVGATTVTVTTVDGKKSASALVLVTAKPVVETTVKMERLYNPNSGEHLFSSDQNEIGVLTRIGWTDEGYAWTAPTTGTPVRRLYNPNTGEHHYTLDEAEVAGLTKIGWTDEGIGWYSAPASTGIPVYRVYNPNASQFSHHYTTDWNEVDHLYRSGWNREGTGWYGVKE